MAESIVEIVIVFLFRFLCSRREKTSLTMDFPRKLKVTQRATERAMIGVFLRDGIRNEEIRRAIKVSDIARRIAKFRRTDDQWTGNLLEWQLRTGKRSVGRPPTRRPPCGESMTWWNPGNTLESWSTEPVAVATLEGRLYPAVEVNRLTWWCCWREKRSNYNDFNDWLVSRKCLKLCK